MGVNLSQINTTNVQPRQAFDALPSGWYNMRIVSAEQKPSSKDPNSSYLKLESEVIDGPFAGRKVFDQVNLWNVNPTAQEIAFTTMRSIYDALGVPGVMSSDELLNKPLKVKVKLKPATAEYDAGNDVKGYDHINSAHDIVTTGPATGGMATGAPTWAAAPAATAAPAAGTWQAPAGTQPWQAPSTAAPAAPGAPSAPPPPPAAAPFPPQGWTAHPTSPGWYYMGQEVLSEADLRARYPAAPAAPTAPAVPGAPVAATAPGGTPPWAV